MYRSPSSPSSRRDRAFTVLDLLTTLAVLGLLVVFSIPSLRKIHDGLELQLAAEEVAGIMRQARQYAVVHNVHVGIKFHHDRDTGFVYMQVYRDGDGDGVRNSDIETGEDLPLAAAQPLTHVGQRVRFGFPDGPMPRTISGRGHIARRGDPIRFSRSDIASFGPMNTATPGTVYLTDGTLRMAAVRISSRNGRLRIYNWNRGSGVWR
ncbi:MAG: GspH/FimT family pseudopilin [Thermoanaerobaculia bacterium]|nr:GspH/FimT family pseudopilin [Thermoanaerobaculia bacterium]